ncbi:MAG: PIN domain-containing protein [Clostridia bacterium]|nr:PIN domain-containing protein [Clostridia bacterium]
MKGKVLVDTNVLVYAYDVSEPVKQRRAIEVLHDLSEREAGAVSVQVMSEMFVALTRKLSSPLGVEQALRTLSRHMRTWHVLDITEFVVLEAARGVRDHQMSYWDAKIWATARLNQIPIILSEDFASGSTMEGVRFVNPFV